MSLMETRSTLLEVNERIANLQKQQKKLTEKLQEACKHEAFIEAESEVYLAGGGLAPRRICLVCGFEEGGWHPGYSHLSDGKKVMKIFSKRDEFYGFRNLKSVDELENIVPFKIMMAINNS